MQTSLDMEEEIDEDILKSINKTVKAEDELKDYIEKERERRRNKNNKVDDKPDISKTTSKYTASVQSVRKHKDVFKITYNVNADKQESQSVPIALPEDEDSKWVRLCKWVGANPEYPTELMGEDIPVQCNGNLIHFPPKKERLNPFKFKFIRFAGKARDKITEKNTDKLIYSSGLIVGLFLFVATIMISLIYDSHILVMPSAILAGILIGKSLRKMRDRGYRLNIMRRISQYLFPE